MHLLNAFKGSVKSIQRYIQQPQNKCWVNCWTCLAAYVAKLCWIKFDGDQKQMSLLKCWTRSTASSDISSNTSLLSMRMKFRKAFTSVAVQALSNDGNFGQNGG